MTDRIAALGGAIAVESTPGVGTTVRGSVPVAELAGR
jgi:signal transduction histidine kinase